jgi:GTP-binding protein
MIDPVDIDIHSGNGGNGAVSGRREKYVPRGGPDGGDGGDGGSVIINSSPNINTLVEFQHRNRFAAENGGHGLGALKHGRNGRDVTVMVPVGTQVWSGSGAGKLLADLTGENESYEVAAGGRGGRGNARFATPTNRFPLLVEEGEPGKTLRVRLELKLLADVGIVGAPNVGKSSLLAAVSGARPKIAGYPFTTIDPVLGVVEHRRDSFVMVEIPGLIEDAHVGVGLGEEFLRHVERTRVLLHMVDGSVEDPAQQFQQVNREMELYNKELLDKPQVVVINKIDLPGVTENAASLRTRLIEKGQPVFFISAVARQGIEPLLDKAIELLADTHRILEQDALADYETKPVLRPKPRSEPVKVRRENGTFVVTAPTAARIAAMIDESDWTARTQFYGYMMRTGIVRALEEAGIGPGDTVRIGRAEWEWG